MSPDDAPNRAYPHAPISTPATASASQRRVAFMLYALGFALLGYGVGFFTGASKSPVVDTLLPLLFGLIGGAGGLHLARAKLQTPEGAQRVAWIGICLATFMTTVLVGAGHGMLLRQGGTWSSLFPGTPATLPTVPASTDHTAQDRVGLLRLRNHLLNLGATSSQSRATLERAAAALTEERDRAALPDHAGVRSSAAALARSLTNVGAALSASPGEDAETVAPFARDLVEQGERLQLTIDGGGPLSAARLTLLSNEIQEVYAAVPFLGFGFGSDHAVVARVRQDLALRRPYQEMVLHLRTCRLELQALGESSGDNVTSTWLESLDGSGGAALMSRPKPGRFIASTDGDPSPIWRDD